MQLESKSLCGAVVSSGASRAVTCAEFRCKPGTLCSRLIAWGYDHFGNQGSKGLIKPYRWKLPVRLLKAGKRVNAHQLKLWLWRNRLKPNYRGLAKRKLSKPAGVA